MITQIHNNLPLIQPPLLTAWDMIIVFLFLALLVFAYFKLFYIKEDEKLTQKIKKKVFMPKTFSLKKMLEELTEIQKQENWKNFALKATEILKLSLEKEYHQKFLFATGMELVEILDNKKILDTQKDKLKYFFEILDPIKFAKRGITEKQAKKIIEIIKENNE